MSEWLLRTYTGTQEGGPQDGFADDVSPLSHDDDDDDDDGTSICEMRRRLRL